MPFDSSCTHPRLVNSALHLTHKGQNISLDLDKGLGNNTGAFTWTEGHDFSKSAQNVRLEGSVLTADLQKPDKKTWNRAQVDLSQIIHVVDGKLVFKSKGNTATPMYFGGSCTHTRLENSYLHVTHKGHDHRLDLDKYLGNIDGTFNWEAQGFSKTARHLSLEGSVLTGELRMKDEKTWNRAKVDLSHKIRFVDEKLVFDPKEQTPPQSPATPPPAYQESFSERLRLYKSMHKSTSETYAYEERSSAYMKFSVDNLHLCGSVFSGRCLQSNGRYENITFDLKDHIGVVAGQLIWGRKGFVSDCHPSSICLQKDSPWILEAQCYCDHSTKAVKKSTLDLSRYLHVFKGKFEVKVIETSHELSEMFSEAKWMKFRVVSEPNPEFLLDFNTFRSSFRQIAESSVKHVVTEVTEEFREMSAKHIRTVLKGDIEQEVNRTVTEVVTTQVKNLVEVEIEKLFAAAKTEVIKACHKMQETVIKEITSNYTNKITRHMVADLSSCVDGLIMQSMTEVSALAIAQFQQHAEILMERELSLATTRSARTQANFLKSLAAQMESSAGISKPNGHSC
ncbi:hypothetical protein AAF712_000156 [Marasmius tenuissimus]|uniref:Cyanovirin-N domain-containing protein n=1 Tax=Marasmius tenuissimus TaxID=585030 RepID=A0ABR3AHB1_9AGAR